MILVSGRKDGGNHVKCSLFTLLPAWTALSMALAAPPMSAAQDRNPLAGNSKAAKAGEYEFRINCALCHGLGARGGGRGADLTRAQNKHAHNERETFHILTHG